MERDQDGGAHPTARLFCVSWCENLIRSVRLTQGELLSRIDELTGGWLGAAEAALQVRGGDSAPPVLALPLPFGQRLVRCCRFGKERGAVFPCSYAVLLPKADALLACGAAGLCEGRGGQRPGYCEPPGSSRPRAAALLLSVPNTKTQHAQHKNAAAASAAQGLAAVARPLQVPGLVKLLLYRLDRYFAPGDVYSAAGESSSCCCCCCSCASSSSCYCCCCCCCWC